MNRPGTIQLRCAAVAMVAAVMLGDTSRGNETLGEKNGYSLTIEVVDGGRDSYAVLSKDGKVLAKGEDILLLLRRCEDEVARRALTDTFIQREIHENGGAAEVQRIADANMKNFGDNFYSHLGTETLDAYLRNGINLGGTRE